MRELREQALERLGDRPLRAEGDGDLPVSGAVQEEFLEILGQIFPWLVERCGSVGHERFELRRVVGLHELRGHFPWPDRPLRDGLLGVDDEIGIEKTLRSDSLAGRACAEVAVEGKMLRREARHREARRRVAEIGGEFLLGPTARAGFHARGHELAAAATQGGFHRVREALAEVGPRHQTVHHSLDPMGFVFLQPNGFLLAEIDDFAIHPQADESLAAGLFNHIAKLAGLPRDKRREDQEFRSFRPAQDGVRDFLRRLARHALAGLGVVGNADRRKKKPQVVVNLGCRGDGGARVCRRSALLDRDRWRKSLDVVHIGLLHLVQKLPRIGRKALDIPPLPLGKERVEGQGGFAGAAGAGDHHQLVARNLDVEVAEVVLPGSLDSDDGGFFGSHEKVADPVRSGTAKTKRKPPPPANVLWMAWA